MTRDEIIKLAQEIAAQYSKAERFQTWTHDFMMQRLMELVSVSAAAEREALQAMSDHAAHAAEVAQRKPLTIEQIDRMWADEWDGFVSFEEARAIVHSVEQAHGVK
jgi:hypothetical protein